MELTSYVPGMSPTDTPVPFSLFQLARLLAFHVNIDRLVIAHGCASVPGLLSDPVGDT